LGVGLLAYLAYTLGGMLTVLVLFSFQNVSSTGASDQFLGQGSWVAASALGAFPFELAVIWFAVRLARWRFSDYLALVWPQRNELVFALATMFIVLQLLGVIGSLIGETQDAWTVLTYRSARDDGHLFILLVVVCIGAPITEEFVVRGFLFRGWSASFLGPWGAIVLSSAVWAIVHFQYDWFGVFEIFVMGLVLGYFRYRSGSTFLTMVVHSAISLYIVLWLSLTN
jgi:membrane protease YdiL (CAAX protease family)